MEEKKVLGKKFLSNLELMDELKISEKKVKNAKVSFRESKTEGK